MKTAIVIGATGLVGRELMHLLLADARFSKVIVFARRSPNITHPKVEEHIIDFDQPLAWQHLVRGDVLFSTLGTTLKQAGGQQAQYKVDYTYQYQFAVAAARNKVPVYVLVSSASASPGSKIFYSRIKGELERDILKLDFSTIYILQPSLLAGQRQEERLGEKIGYRVLKALNAVGLLKKYRPIQAKVVAQAMVNAALAPGNGIHMHTLDEIFKLAH
jgi:uncharacterized protein YbjT (DUF2867 family)